MTGRPAADGLHLRRWGRADGRPLLFLHSLGPASSAAFLGLAAQPLVDAGYAVAGPDLPGFGGSSPVDADQYAVPALAARVADVADALGWDRFVLVGHSWGGAIACHLTAARPDRVRALVLVDSGHLDYADTPGADLGASLDELVARGNDRRLRLADRAAAVGLLEVAEDDPLTEAFLEGMEPHPGRRDALAGGRREGALRSDRGRLAGGPGMSGQGLSGDAKICLPPAHEAIAPSGAVCPSP